MMPLSDEAIDRLRRDIMRRLNKRSTTEQIVRFTKQVRHASSIYETARISVNLVRSKISEICRIASLQIDKPLNYELKPQSSPAKRYRMRILNQHEALTEVIAQIDVKTLNILRERLIQRFGGGGGIINATTLLPIKEVSGSKMACPAEYLALIASLTQSGRFYETTVGDDGRTRITPGKLRPTGRPSRPSPQLRLYAPDAEQNPMKRGPERELEAYLALAWVELASDYEPRQSEAYVTFVADFLDEAGVAAVDVLRLVREADLPVQARRREDAMKRIGRLPPDLLEPLEAHLRAERAEKNNKIENLSGGDS